MNPFEMVVLIIAIVTIGKIVQSKYRGMDREDRPSGEQDFETRQLREEMRMLRDRVQVLERVITDNHASADLDREIERLRDRG